MDLKELDYIVTVANEGSISRAAEKLFMAQSSLSQAVRLFEQDLGDADFCPYCSRGPSNLCRGGIYFPCQTDFTTVPGGAQRGFGYCKFKGRHCHFRHQYLPGNLPAAAGPEKIPCPVSTGSCGDL